MSRKYGGKLIYQFFRDNSDDTDDSANGYRRLEHTGEPEASVVTSTESTESKPVNSSAKPAGKRRHGKSREVYTDVDAKGKRISSKLRRKEMRKRIGHALHSTWKWVKRGAIAATPSIASIFIISPVPVFTVATSVSGQRQKGRSYYV